MKDEKNFWARKILSLEFICVENKIGIFMYFAYILAQEFVFMIDSINLA